MRIDWRTDPTAPPCRVIDEESGRQIRYCSMADEETGEYVRYDVACFIDGDNNRTHIWNIDPFTKRVQVIEGRCRRLRIELLLPGKPYLKEECGGTGRDADVDVASGVLIPVSVPLLADVLRDAQTEGGNSGGSREG
jgi:hypothetical protein